MSKQADFEKLAADTLANKQANATAVEALVQQIEVEIAHADNAAVQAKERAHDPAREPNAKLALEAMQLAEFSAARLRTLLPRLRNHLVYVIDAEARARFDTAFLKHKPVLDAAAEKFADRYQTLSAAMVDLFNEMAAVDAASDAVNELARDLAGEPRRCRKVELAARDLAGFSNATPSVVANTVLPSWEHSDQTAWPVKPPPPDPAFYDLMNGRRSHTGEFTANWWVASAEQKERDRIAQVEAEKQATIERDRFWGKV